MSVHMYSKWLVRVGYLFAVLLAASGVAHALAGWPGLQAELVADGLRADSPALGAAAAGWLFGSICMFAFAAMFVAATQGIENGQSRRTPARMTLLIGVGYLLFGTGGCIYRGFGLHFLAFAVLGILFVAWSVVVGSTPGIRRGN